MPLPVENTGDSMKPALFTHGDIAKVLKGARAAGMTVASVEIDRTGKIVARFGAAGQSDAGNEWDEVLNGEEKRSSG